VFRKEIFEYLGEGEDLVDEPFARLIENDELMAHRYDGFWIAMDTFKDKQALDALYESGRAPWEIWRDRDTPRSEE
jgi:glucose-1-phosphate cytidylyltransferase